MFDTFCLFKFPFHLALPLSLKIFFSGDVGKIIMWSTQFLLRCPPVLSTDIMTWLFTHPDPSLGGLTSHCLALSLLWSCLCPSDKLAWIREHAETPDSKGSRAREKPKTSSTRETRVKAHKTPATGEEKSRVKHKSLTQQMGQRQAGQRHQEQKRIGNGMIQRKKK